MTAGAQGQVGQDPAGPVVLHIDGSVAVLTLARPAVLNAIDAEVCDALVRHVEYLERDGQVRVLVIAGEGDRAFSAGADLKHMRGLAGAGLRRFIEHTWFCFERLSRSPIISIAALHGYVLGGGLELALACDLRVAEDGAVIGLPEMTLGSVPGSGAMQRLPVLIGPSRTLELATSGMRLDAAQALEWGLINRAVPAGAARTQALAWARRIAERPAQALRYAKAAIRVRDDPVLAAALHGLVSDSCHSEKKYQDNTDRFRHSGP